MYETDGLDDCVSYSFSADVWSLGVLVLNMVSYFPNERFHRLATDFALIMQKESMPFHWLIADMIVWHQCLSTLEPFFSNCALV